MVPPGPAVLPLLELISHLERRAEQLEQAEQAQQAARPSLPAVPQLRVEYELMRGQPVVFETRLAHGPAGSLSRTWNPAVDPEGRPVLLNAQDACEIGKFIAAGINDPRVADAVERSNFDVTEASRLMRSLLDYQAEAMLSQMGEQEVRTILEPVPACMYHLRVTMHCRVNRQGVHQATQVTICTRGRPARWCNPHLESGEPCTLSSHDARRAAYIAMRYIINGAEPDAHIPPSMDPTAARRLMLALIIRLPTDMVQPDPAAPLVLTVHAATSFFRLMLQASELIISDTQPPAAAVAPSMAVVPLFPSARTTYTVDVASNSSRIFTLALTLHSIDVTTTHLSFTRGGTLTRPTIGPPMANIASAQPARLTEYEFGCFTCALMGCLEDVANFQAPFDATLVEQLRISRTSLLQLLQQAHASLLAGLRTPPIVNPVRKCARLANGPSLPRYYPAA